MWPSADRVEALLALEVLDLHPQIREPARAAAPITGGSTSRTTLGNDATRSRPLGSRLQRS